MNTDSLFRPFSLKSLNIKNRIVMAPMTRSFSPDGIPTPEVAVYYRKRAEGEVGLILSEGTVIDRPASSNDKNIPHFYGEQALSGWKNVIDQVHGAGGKMGPQIWHMGVMENHHSGWVPSSHFEGPSGFNKPGLLNGKAMTETDIADTIAAYGRAAAEAKRLGFDYVFGGKTLPERSRFAIEVIKEVRKQVGDDFAVIIRLSQWKPQEYTHKLAVSPAEMEAWLNPLAEAG
eukprot:gene19569-23268_t